MRPALLANAIERLLQEAFGASLPIEVDAHQPVYTDDQGDKQRRGSFSVGYDDRMGLEGCPPRRFPFLVQIAARVLNGLLNRRGRHLKRLGQLTEEPLLSVDTARAHALKSSKPLGSVFVAAAPDQFARGQLEVP